MTSIPEAAEDLAIHLRGASLRTWTDEQVVAPEDVHRYALLHRYESPGSVVPPGFGAVLTMRAVLQVLHDAELALPFDRNVHAAQDLRWPNPMRLGSKVRTTARVDNIKVRQRAVFFDVLTQTCCDAEVVLMGVATQAVRHA